MKTKPLFILIGCAVVLSTLLIVQRFISYMTVKENIIEKRIEPNWVRGAFAVANNKPYTLNFDQQLALLTVINEAELLAESATTPVTLPINKLVISRFSKESDVEIQSGGVQNNRMVLRMTGLNISESLLIEKQPGSLKKLIDSITL